MITVHCLSGVSGSGKSTYAKEHMLPGEYVVSADDFFTDPVTGEYKFDPALLGEAHAQCFRKFISALERSTANIWASNTNTTVPEIAPYHLASRAFGANFLLKTLYAEKGQLEACAERCVHSVPLATIQRQWENIEARIYNFTWGHRLNERIIYPQF